MGHDVFLISMFQELGATVDFIFEIKVAIHCSNQPCRIMVFLIDFKVKDNTEDGKASCNAFESLSFERIRDRLVNNCASSQGRSQKHFGGL